MLAPEPSLIALHRVLYVATTTAKNLAASDATPRKQIEILLDAVNHIPELLCDWKRFSESTLLIHLGCYDQAWGDAYPNVRLIEVYTHTLESARRGENWAVWPRPQSGEER